MKIFDKSCLEEMAKVEDGVEYIFEYIDCGRVFQDVCINYQGTSYTKTESCFNDIETGKELDTYRYYENNNLRYVVRNLDNTLELA